MDPIENTIKVAVYGAGRFANSKRIPNLKEISGVEIVAVCDVNPEAANATAEAFQIPSVYREGREMLEKEEIDVLYSIVPAFAREDVEAAAAEKGIHIFSEKPQATTMRVARRIDDAITKSGVLSTVGFRERYRPVFQEAKSILRDKRIVHVRFQSFRGLPRTLSPDQKDNWWAQMEKSGGPAFDWGVHATDYTRYMSGLNIVRSQAFYHQSSDYHTPLACSFNYQFSNGATMVMSFVCAGGVYPREPWFVIFFEGGCMAIHHYDRIEVNGEAVFRTDDEDFDPWLAQDRAFIEAVRSGRGELILNDYHDGLYSLAPVLAGWESSRRSGECIDVNEFMLI